MSHSLPTTIFLDRDGVINAKAPEGDYVKSWSEFRFLPGALEAIGALAGIVPRLIVVSNQRGIALGVMSEPDLSAIHENMLKRDTPGRRPDRFHLPLSARKAVMRLPQAQGLAFSKKHGKSFLKLISSARPVVGDSLADLEAASRLSSMPVLVTTRSRLARHSQSGPAAGIPRSGASLVAAGL